MSPYPVGNCLTYADLVVANCLDVATEYFGENILDDFPGLQDLKDYVFGLPAIEEWCSKRTVTAAQ